MARINGTAGNDTLTGTKNKDSINGLGGSDTIAGGASADTMTGGAGADAFRFASGDGKDVITDFQVGLDRLVFPSASSLQITHPAEGDSVQYSSSDYVTLNG